jgi:hypothetical protein
VKNLFLPQTLQPCCCTASRTPWTGLNAREIRICQKRDALCVSPNPFCLFPPCYVPSAPVSWFPSQSFWGLILLSQGNWPSKAFFLWGLQITRQPKHIWTHAKDIPSAHQTPSVLRQYLPWQCFRSKTKIKLPMTTLLLF